MPASPSPPGSQEIGADSIVLALRSLFDADAAGELEASYELRLGEARFGVIVSGGGLELSREEGGEHDGVIETDPGTLAAVLTGQLPLDEAVASGAVAVEGNKRAIARFLRLFPMPEAEPCPGAPAEASLA